MRFHTVYGPIPRANMFFDKLLNNKLEYVTAHKRDFIHIEDLMDAIEIIMQDKVVGPIDVGTGSSGERKLTQANIKRLRDLGFRPKHTVAKFLKDRGIK